MPGTASDPPTETARPCGLRRSTTRPCLAPYDYGRRLLALERRTLPARRITTHLHGRSSGRTRKDYQGIRNIDEDLSERIRRQRSTANPAQNRHLAPNALKTEDLPLSRLCALACAKANTTLPLLMSSGPSKPIVDFPVHRRPLHSLLPLHSLRALRDMQTTVYLVRTSARHMVRQRPPLHRPHPGARASSSPTTSRSSPVAPPTTGDDPPALARLNFRDHGFSSSSLTISDIPGSTRPNVLRCSHAAWAP